jgi:hypothetical protein
MDDKKLHAAVGIDPGLELQIEQDIVFRVLRVEMIPVGRSSVTYSDKEAPACAAIQRYGGQIAVAILLTSHSSR